MQIAGKVALITGASAGIGAALVDNLRQRGAKLSLVGRSAERLKAAAGLDALSIPVDLQGPSGRRRAVESTLDRFGAIDILINNAGVGLYAPSWRAPMDDVRRMMELNFFTAIEMTQLAVPSMRARRSGMIVNVGSIAGKVTLPWFTLYSAGKYALGSFTDGLRMELRQDGIHAMTVCPGYVDTDFQAHVLGGAPPASIRKSRMFKISAAECAEAIAKGIERDARQVVTPWAGWLFVAVERLFPGFIDRRLEKIYLSGTGG